MLKKEYFFSGKEHAKEGIMSVILGILSIVTYIAAVYFSYLHGGEDSVRYGTAGLFAVLYMVTGLLLGIRGCLKKETFKFFSVLGIILNLIAFMELSIILYAGAYAA